MSREISTTLRYVLWLYLVVKYVTEEEHEMGLVLSPNPRKEYAITRAAVVNVVAVPMRAVMVRRLR